MVMFYEIEPSAGFTGPSQGFTAVRILNAARRFDELYAMRLELLEHLPNPLSMSFKGVVDQGRVVPRLDWTGFRIEPQTLDKFSTVAGEIVQHARIALEYFFQNEVLRADSSFDPKRLQFPVCDTADSWKDATKKHRKALAVLPEIVLRAIECVQPFLGGTWLGALRDLSNSDKHRQPLRVAPTLGAEVPEILSTTYSHRVSATLRLRIADDPERRDFIEVMDGIFRGLIGLVNPRLVYEGHPPINYISPPVA